MVTEIRPGRGGRWRKSQRSHRDRRSSHHRQPRRGHAAMAV